MLELLAKAEEHGARTLELERQLQGAYEAVALASAAADEARQQAHDASTEAERRVTATATELQSAVQSATDQERSIASALSNWKRRSTGFSWRS